jgi:hypothetical protein
MEYHTVSHNHSVGPDKSSPWPEVSLLLGFNTASLIICSLTFKHKTVVSFLRIKYPNSMVTGFHTQFHNIHTITCSVSLLVYWAIVYIHTKSSLITIYVKSSVSISYCGGIKCIQVKNGLWQFYTYKNDKLLCIYTCVCVCARARVRTCACIHLFIQKKSPTSDNMT